MRVIVPFDGRDPKTRLSTLLDYGDRNEFARAMLRDVISVVQDTGRDPLVLSSTPLEIGDCPVSVDERSLSRAVNERLQAASSAVAVIMADLPLVTDAALERLCTREGDVVLARGIGGGTNALVSRTTDFEVDYHGNSYLTHRSTAREIGAALAEIDSYRLATDIDEPDDLAELLLHGEGHATQWLRDQGFRLASGTGRTTVRRTDVTHEPSQ